MFRLAFAAAALGALSACGGADEDAARSEAAGYYSAQASLACFEKALGAGPSSAGFLFVRKLDSEKVPTDREVLKTAENLRLSGGILLQPDVASGSGVVYLAFASNDDDAAEAEAELEKRWLEESDFHKSVEDSYGSLAAAHSRNAVYWHPTDALGTEKGVQERVQKCLKR